MIKDEELTILNESHSKAIDEYEDARIMTFYVSKKATFISYLFHAIIAFGFFYLANFFTLSGIETRLIVFNELFLSCVGFVSFLYAFYNNINFEEKWKYDIIDPFTILEVLFKIFSKSSFFGITLSGFIIFLDSFIGFVNPMQILNNIIHFSFGVAFTASTIYFLFFQIPKALNSEELLEKTIQWSDRSSVFKSKLEESTKNVDHFFEKHIHNVFDIEILEKKIENNYCALEEPFQKIKLLVAVENGFITYDEYRLDFMKNKSKNETIINT